MLSQYQYGKFILALVVADKSLFEQEDFKQLRNWGISHLFAISGLHIGILMGLMIIICRQLSRVLPMFCSMKFCHFVSVLLIWWYLAILDFPVSATRATLLLTFGLSLLHCRLYLQAFNLIGIVMVASLVIDPTNMVKPAWWLSVSAVCSLFLIIRLWPNSSEQTFDEVVKQEDEQEDEQEENARGCGGKAVSHVVCNKGALINKINKHTALKIVVMPFVLSFSRNKQRIISIANNVILNLQRLFILQVALTLGMLPVVIYWMQGIPLLGLVNNIIVIPLFSLVIVPAIFVGTIVELISGSKGIGSTKLSMQYLTGYGWC
ncbi:ComEC/Rec2 family competence protein [Psychrosphaera algicola]|uniref:ComEC/Rec2 family competence protein n=1 Tax=Psychrosphaera algicola TaxID=3023714 RepID=A0ABT5FBV0_9GAMM|nr:ComEC/Rec2 family competence protein [Psychrosphaera sp. G1-22]MDC2888035.1 ComEC/Rec2 family competence protein [Psychrosphaera sp. G1-22]